MIEIHKESSMKVGGFKMSKVRQDAWLDENDELLAECSHSPCNRR